MNLVILAEEALERLGERVSLDFEGEKFTNAAGVASARRLQRAFTELGMKRGEIAVVCMTNHPRVYDAFWGVFRTGGTAVPVMPTSTESELRYVLEDTRARGVITDEFCLPKVRAAVKGLDSVEWVVVRGGSDDLVARPRGIALDTLLTSAPETRVPEINAEEDVALMIYTSGTTGRPKGVMLTHRNLVAAAEASNRGSEMDRWEGPLVAVSAMPMAHIFGISIMTSGYLLPKEIDGYIVQLRWFDAAKVIQLIDLHRANTLPAVPTMLTMILSHPDLDSYDLTCLRQVFCGAAPLAPELAMAFQRRFDCRVIEAYGMTENAGIATSNRPSEPFRPGSVGKPYFNVDLRIVDDDDRDLPPGERGEIVTRGATVMKGYFGRADASAETLRNGWLHTGDIGHLDEEGYLYIVDRKKDMIIKGGENIYPAEIEAVLYEHPDVVEAAIVGTPDEKYGEVVVAFVVPKQGSNLTAAAIIDYLSDRIGRFKAPDFVVLRESLPKIGVGKILRRELREDARIGARAASAALASPSSVEASR